MSFTMTDEQHRANGEAIFANTVAVLSNLGKDMQFLAAKSAKGKAAKAAVKKTIYKMQTLQAVFFTKDFDDPKWNEAVRFTTTYLEILGAAKFNNDYSRIENRFALAAVEFLIDAIPEDDLRARIEATRLFVNEVMSLAHAKTLN